jgi:glycosyltransferase involved in cell wall biosynthesis
VKINTMTDFKLIVQIPALNEERTIAEVIARIPRPIPGLDAIGVVVVDDGSTDRTGEIARAAGAEVVRHEKPRGVGAAFRSGLEASSRLGADIIVTIDADGQFNPEDIPKLVEPILRGEAEFVTASRFKDPALVPEMPPMKRWGNDVIARWISRIIRKKFDDVSCGFRAYSRNAYLRLVLLGEFTYTHETFICLAYARVPMARFPWWCAACASTGRRAWPTTSSATPPAPPASSCAPTATTSRCASSPTSPGRAF